LWLATLPLLHSVECWQFLWHLSLKSIIISLACTNPFSQ
jgi:hypothetical protein